MNTRLQELQARWAKLTKPAAELAEVEREIAEIRATEAAEAAARAQAQKAAELEAARAAQAEAERAAAGALQAFGLALDALEAAERKTQAVAGEPAARVLSYELRRAARRELAVLAERRPALLGLPEPAPVDARAEAIKQARREVAEAEAFMRQAKAGRDSDLFESWERALQHRRRRLALLEGRPADDLGLTEAERARAEMYAAARGGAFGPDPGALLAGAALRWVEAKQAEHGA